MSLNGKLQYAIVGGGITGLTLAIALHSRGLSVTIYEQASRFGEIGAGVGFTPNAIQAMKVGHLGIYEAFNKVCTRNVWPSKQDVWFDYFDGSEAAGEEAKSQRPAFTIRNETGQCGVHRAHFLDELVKLVPSSIARFGKRLESISEDESGLLSMTFADGTTSLAHAILGCDGIKSRVRQLLFGVDHPCAHPAFTHKYAYRALVPMDAAIAVLGEEKAQNSCMYMGQDNHMLTFPINHGQIMNVVAFHTTSKNWPDSTRLTAPATREDALGDFADFGGNVKRVLELAKPELDTWAIFDTGEHPVPSFAEGRVCLVGDAAHASSPHHGAGAGMCIEDSVLLAALLADKAVTNVRTIRIALAVYDNVRRERGQWLVQSSRHIGNCYEWRGEGVGRDFKKIEDEINRRNGIIANVDVELMCKEAREELSKSLGMVK